MDNEIDKIKRGDQLGIFSNTKFFIFRIVTDLNQGMELFDHAVLYEKTGTGHQFYSKALELTTGSFRKNSIVEPVPFLSEGQSQVEPVGSIFFGPGPD